MISTLFRALRVYQWSKNLLVFAALIFAQQLYVADQVVRSLIAFGAFCAASSAMYLFNDVADVENDRVHPEKRTRPLASGAMSIPAAIAIALILIAASGALSFLLSGRFALILAAYLALVGAYSLGLKRVIIVDVIVVAMGFVIRAMAGAIALDVSFSNWLVVCTMFMALFLGFSKRRHEINLLDHEALNHREVLGHYSVAYLDAVNVIVAGGAIITYTIYTCSREVVERLGTDKLYLTLPLVLYGLFRYLYLVHHDLDGGDPSSTLLKDRSLTITVALWGLACIGIIYWKSAA
ncbi:MAG: decaprenyl-phosphate phosphoribosyltransferase [Nitrospiraceae bacterium]|nr:decaprenyl-phosphate phosphoribosyltransferase [Nitrospiraceae bacterium]